MSDYGFRISQNGQDVKTCSDLQTVVNSKYAFLKGTISGNGTVNVPSGTVNTITIAHNLGYIPFGRAMVDASNSGVYYKLPYINDTMNVTQEITDRSDASNYYIDFNWTDYIGSSTGVFPYKYFVFIDKGKI